LQFDFRDMQAELAKAQAKHRKQGTRTDLHPYDVRKLSDQGADGGNRSAYLLRRLARDHPEATRGALRIIDWLGASA
jgi:hypothetical protein